MQKRKKYKYVNGTKGVISIFLAVLMVPFSTIACALINAARIDSAVAVFDEALCNASNSTLGTYDEFLRKRFGLLALSQNVSSKHSTLTEEAVQETIQDTFEFYMEENLKSLSNTYTASETNVTGVYPLADDDVMLSEILNYSKYSVPALLVEDGLNVDEIGKTLDNLLSTTWISRITTGCSMAATTAELADDLEGFKDAVKEQDTAGELYEKAYTAFESAVNQYDTDKAAFEKDLNQRKATIDSERATTAGNQTKISDLESQISDWKSKEDKDHDYSKEISDLETQKTNLVTENNKVITSLNTHVDEYNSKLTEYNTRLAEEKQAISDTQTAYASAIAAYSGKLAAVKGKLETLQNNMQSIASSAADIYETEMNADAQKEKSQLEKEIKDLDQQIGDLGSDESQSKTLLETSKTNDQNRLDSLNEDIKANKNVASAYGSFLSDTSDSVSRFETTEYDKACTELNALKLLVQAYSYDAAPGKLDAARYYKTGYDLMEEDDCDEVIQNLGDTVFETSIWSAIKSLCSFIKAMFDVVLFYDPQLECYIDDSYYQESYGGLPSEKTRTLSTGNSEDSAISDQYKALLGDYSTTDNSALTEFDFLGEIGSLFTAIGTIMSDVNEITTGWNIFAKFGCLKDIMTQISQMITSLTNIIRNASDIVSSMESKALLTGYMSYALSDRMTYEGKSSLTNTSFNLRNQNETSTGYTGLKSIDSFTTLFSVCSQEASGSGDDYCFAGAEKEYLIAGTHSEVQNQVNVFLQIYLVRLLVDMPTVMSDPEVLSISSAALIAQPIVMIIYLLAEPLADTILLVNGGEIPLVKTFCYLTPYGLESFVSEFTEKKVSSEQLAKEQKSLVNAMTGGNTKFATDYADSYSLWGSSYKADGLTKFFSYGYSDYLFLVMMFIPSDTILERFEDIVEMEALQNQMEKGVGTIDRFDLDYSYTYIRAEGKFTTNEFLNLSGSSGLNSTNRLIYTGY